MRQGTDVERELLIIITDCRPYCPQSNTAVEWYSLHVRDRWRTFPAVELLFLSESNFPAYGAIVAFGFKGDFSSGNQASSLPELKYSHRSGSQRASCWSFTSVRYKIRHICSVRPQCYTFINKVEWGVKVAVIAVQIIWHQQEIYE